MKLETAIKKVVDFLQSNPASTKEQIAAGSKVKGIELTNAIRALRKQERLEETGEGKEMTFTLKTEDPAENTPAKETEIPVEDEQLPAKSKGRNNDKYQFNGNAYGKGPLVREVVKQYVVDHRPNLKKLTEAFPPELLHRFGIWQTLEKAQEISGARERYFFKEEHQIKLADRKVIVVCNQFTADNIQPFLKAAKALGFKIK